MMPNGAPPLPLPDEEEEGSLYVLVEVQHVYPLFGRRHILRPHCWCHPEWDNAFAGVLVHNVDN